MVMFAKSNPKHKKELKKKVMFSNCFIEQGHLHQYFQQGIIPSFFFHMKGRRIFFLPEIHNRLLSFILLAMYLFICIQ